MSPSEENKNAKEAIITPNSIALTNTTAINTSIPEGGISNPGKISQAESKAAESSSNLPSPENEVTRVRATANDEESNEESHKKVMQQSSTNCLS